MILDSSGVKSTDPVVRNLGLRPPANKLHKNKPVHLIPRE